MQSRANPLQTFVMKILSQPKFSWAVILPMSFFDMTAWLSVSMLCLLILRQGIIKHANLIAACTVLHVAFLYWSHPNIASVVRAITDFLPGILGALILLYSRSWTLSAISMLGLLFVVYVLVDVLAPGFGADQLKMLSNLTQNMSTQMNLPIGHLDRIIQNHFGFFVSLMIGVQIMSALFNAVISLTMARSLQAQIFNPGGFLTEMLTLRGNQYLLATLFLLLLMAWSLGWSWCLYLIPSILFYFYCVGLSIGICIFAKHRIQLVLFILVLASVLLSYIFVPIFVMAGALDSLINLRVLLAKRIKYTF